MHLVRPIHTQKADLKGTEIGKVSHPILPERLMHEVWFRLNLGEVYSHWDDNKKRYQPGNPQPSEFPFEEPPGSLFHQRRNCEITGDEEKINGFIEVMRPQGIIEMVRTGSVAMGRGSSSLLAGIGSYASMYAVS